MEFLLTTNAGLEDIVKAELVRHGAELDPPIVAADVDTCPFGCLGRVLLRRPKPLRDIHSSMLGGGSGSGAVVEARVERVLLGLRSIHDALWHHMVMHLQVPEEMAPAIALYEQVRALPLNDVHGGPVPPLLGGTRSFRVSCVREGEQPTPITSIEVEREVGGALQELYNAPCAMKEFDLRIRVDLSRSTILIGTALNREPLSRRHKLAFTRSVTLKPTVAFALLHLARCEPGHVLLDPCCGSGTLPLEAALAFPGLVAHGVDKSGAVVKGAQANCCAEQLQDRCSFSAGNCRELHALFAEGTFDRVVTNAPW